MAILHANKPEHSSGEVLKGNAEFVKWLMKEFKLPPYLIAEKVLVYTPEKRSLIVMLHEKAPSAHFKQLDRVVEEGSTENILENLKTLEDNRVQLSKYISLLLENPKQLNDMIALLKDDGLDVGKYIYLAWASKLYIETNLKTLKDRHIKPTEFAYPSHLRDKPEDFNRFLDEPAKQRVKMYSFKDKGYYYYMVERELFPKEVEVFNELGRRIEENGGISREEMRGLFDEKIKYSSELAAQSRFNRIVHKLLLEGVLEEYYATVERPKQLVLKQAGMHS